MNTAFAVHNCFSSVLQQCSAFSAWQRGPQFAITERMCCRVETGNGWKCTVLASISEEENEYDKDRWNRDHLKSLQNDSLSFRKVVFVLFMCSR